MLCKWIWAHSVKQTLSNTDMPRTVHLVAEDTLLSLSGVEHSVNLAVICGLFRDWRDTQDYRRHNAGPLRTFPLPEVREPPFGLWASS